MNIEPFDFSRPINKIELYQHLCYYYNEANNSIDIVDENKKLSFNNFKQLYNLLKKEYHEYQKSKNYKYIRSNNIYKQYVRNITNASVNLIKVNSYKELNSNLYNIKDYVSNGFGNIFFRGENNVFDKNKIDNFIDKICCVYLNNFNIYIGQVNIKLNELIKNENISVLFLGEWQQININDIEKIKIIEE